MVKSGLFIVIEGSDGSGKTTQFNLLKERLRATGYDVAVFDFPRYSEKSSFFVKQYLAGSYGPAGGVSPFTASIFYALDRYEAAKDIKKALNEGKIVLANRYVGSNMAHQGSKFKDPAEQRGFFVWADNLEYRLLGIPRPDLSFFLRVPANVSMRLIKERAAKTGTKLDEHEKDVNHLKQALHTYDVLCRLFPKDFAAIECAKDEKILSVAEINNRIWRRLKPLLPDEKPHPSHSVVVTLGNGEKKLELAEESLPDEISIPIKDSSLLLKLLLQRNIPGMYLDIAKWSESGYDFYAPMGMPKNIDSVYRSTMQQLAQAHKQLHEKLTRYIQTNLLSRDFSGVKISDIVLATTPLSALSSYKIRLKKSRVVEVTSILLANDSTEAQWTAKQIYLAARQKWPDDFKQPLESSDGPESINNIIAKLAEERLPQENSHDHEIKLLEAHPRLEFDLLAESIYPYTNLSLDEISEEVSSWPYLQKYESLKQAASQPDLLRHVSYKIDVVSDQIALNGLLSDGEFNELKIQSYTPRYGFDVPEIIEDAGADDIFNDCFDASLKLYSILQGAGREDLAPYATLLGHKSRWQFSADAASLLNILLKPKPSYKKLARHIAEQVSEVHPLLWEAIGGVEASAKARNGKSRVKQNHQTPSKKRRR